MSELRKANTDATYFVTLTIVGWVDLFTRSRYSNMIIESFTYCQKHKNLDLFAYVIMPSHIHMLARNTDGKLNHILRDFKSYSAKRIIDLIANEPGESRKEWLIHMFQYYAKDKKQNTKHQLWQKTNHPIEMLSLHMVDQKIDYIHNNPVEAGYVTRPECWTYSSASEIQLIETLPT